MGDQRNFSVQGSETPESRPMVAFGMDRSTRKNCIVTQTNPSGIPEEMASAERIWMRFERRRTCSKERAA